MPTKDNFSSIKFLSRIFQCDLYQNMHNLNKLTERKKINRKPEIISFASEICRPFVISVLLVCITCKLTLCCLYRAGLFIYLFIRNHWMYSTLHKICTNIWICWQDEKIFALPLKMYHVLIYSLVFLIITWFCKKINNIRGSSVIDLFQQCWKMST